MARALLSMSSMPSIPTATAQQQPTIYTDSFPYSYLGCLNETTDIPNTNGARALADGKVWAGTGYMTVPMCLGFCGGGPGQVYRFVGLEYSRECWCADVLNGLSVKLDDSACALQCDGNAAQLCGGPLKLSVYVMTSNQTMANISTMGSSSPSMAVASWILLWVAAAMLIIRD
ncbi:hypothetical protein VSDG_02119 [Cytospora chrysosperma]|uniref:WSC domain-containing protein n=1 Tax=Cytospora chrysosperma TaxID=252740 RepID=A0A423WE39_CYTCH|nr:hypothetical protein VSDG_02119 [Valsa sordida]